MGACDFYTTAKGKTAKEAFENATSDARYESGSGGYSGTIAEKHRFTVIVPDDLPQVFVNGDARREWFSDRARRYIEDDDRRVCDKFGPAGCMVIEDGLYLFFGWASS